MNSGVKLTLALAVLRATAGSLQADSTAVFNEIMYHPPTNETALEWVELHSQMAVDMDLSGWQLDGGVRYSFPSGTVMPGGGYLVVAISPSDLMAAAGLTNVLGPFTGRLGNSGDTLELRDNNGRLMDSMSYGVDGDWPVGPDGSGVSLAKLDEDTASSPSHNWGISALAGGTPGRRNFALKPFEVTNTAPQTINGTWKFNASGADLGTAWRDLSFDDSAWSSGPALFQAGNITLPLADPQSVPSAFSTGVGADGSVVAPGLPDPHYQLTLSAQSTPPPPPIAATVILNHPAWLANDSLSSWIGPINPGTAGAAEGNYYYRTVFSLDGFSPASASLKLLVAADNRVNDVLLNGLSLGISFAGFSTWSSAYNISTGLLAGTNTLDFYTANDCCGVNPAGFRATLNVTARKAFQAQTFLPAGRTNFYFRTRFSLEVAPSLALLKLNTLAADGAVFYLNGTEVLRLNMPAGPVNAATLAVSNVSNPAYTGPFTLPNSALVLGTNVLAVELHQAAGGSNDVVFGADLALTTTNILVPPPVTLAFNEFSSATNADFWIEIINYGNSPMDLTGCVLARQGGATNREYVFPAQSLAPGALVQMTKAALGFGADPGDRLFLYRADRNSLLDAVVAKRIPRARWPDGTGAWWYPTALTPGASNLFVVSKDVVINEIMYHPPDLPPTPALYSTNLLVTLTNTWRYDQSGLNLGTAWNTPAFSDASWLLGQGVFYTNLPTLAAPKGATLALSNAAHQAITTYYFRTPFVVTNPAEVMQLSLNHVIDDGAVFYINGTEVFRYGMAAGTITYTTRATNNVGTPALLGPVLIPTNCLVAGTNLLAVEVHQYLPPPGSKDVAFGLGLMASVLASPALSVRSSPESWLELFNRGTNAADLTGWQLGHDIDYAFPPGTRLAAGGYLVVAKDVGFMEATYPGITVLGPFTNDLRHSSSHIQLLDPAGNPADEVRYYDSKPWPGYADGGGSSLELRDPWADNSKPEAWAASREAARSSWTWFTNRAFATNLLGPTQWNEFQMGLLDAGECLIDDLHVVESPGGSPVEFLQNGTFETGLSAWRALGDHAYSQVETDPANSANHLLHLITTGWTYHLHDHLETTYANNAAVTDGREYQVSFRAKWVAGNNHLNTRLYFNRLARTFDLPMPAQHGTPGQRNSTYATNLGPTFESLAQAPIIPQPGDAVTFSVNASDPQGVSAIRLRWAENSGVWQSTNMLPASGMASPGYATYAATIGGWSSGTLVQFFIEAVDGLGAIATFPAGGTNSRALFKVDEGKPLMPLVHRLRLLMLPADAEALHAHTNVMTYDDRGLTVVYDERKVFYDVGIHLQSSERGRDDPNRVGFSIALHADDLFRGVQNSLTLDRSGGQSGLGGRHDEIVLWHAINHAGGLYGLYPDLVQQFAPRSSEDSTALMRMSAYDADYWDSCFANGSQGNLYKLEIIYYPTTTATGDPQAPKLPQPDNVIDIEIMDRGPDKENYRWPFLQENHADSDDYSGVIALNQAFSLNSPALDAQLEQVMDVDEFLRTMAFKAFTGDVDTYGYGLSHNFKFFFRPEDGKAMGLLWDMDYSFVNSISAPFPGGGSANTYKVITLPNNLRRYYNHLYDLSSTTVNAAYLGPWAARYASRLGQDWSGVVSYLDQRAAFIRSALPLSTPFSITSNGGNNFATSNATVTLAGTSPINARDIQVNGGSYPLLWTSPTNWSLTVPLTGYTNLLIVQGVDNSGAPLTSLTAAITVTNLGLPAPRPVVINEWVADNAGPGGFLDVLSGKHSDWFELYNPNPSPVNLSGFYLTDTLSQPAKWQIPTNTVIAAHGFLLVWADNKTNLNGLDTNGDLHANFQLNNSGEAIGLCAPDGTPQHNLTFGAQTQNVSQGLFPDGNTNAIVSMPDWTPRASNRLGAPATPGMTGTMVQNGGLVSFSFGTVPNRTYRVEYKDDLEAAGWTPLGTDLPATGALLNVTDLLNGQAQRFYRVVLLQ